MNIEEITFNSAEYREALKLREDVLRAPLGQSLSRSDVANERNQLHFGVFDEDKLIACVLIKALSQTSGKLRQMAVSPMHQGRGIGRQLIVATEQMLADKGYEEIELAARETAVGFYERLGYAVASEPYLELGIEHVRMRKCL